MRWISRIVLAAFAATMVIGIVRRMGHAPEAPAPLAAVKVSRQVMGTLASIEAVGPAAQSDQLRAAVDRAYGIVSRVESLMSHYKPDSLISRINREAHGRPVELDPWTFNVVRQSRLFRDLSGGAFDPTCGPLIELWKEAARQDRLPSDEQLAAAKTRSGFDKVILDEAAQPPTIRFTQPGMRLDLGGIAKGYAIDLAIEELKKAGCTGGLVDIGGDIRTFGKPDDDAHWNIAVQNPFRQGALLYLAVNDAAVCTSGNYHRFAIIQGHRYSHIIDPRTGRPAQVTPSVTIVGAETTGADALATALSVLGPKPGLEMINALHSYEAMIILGEPDAFEKIESSGFAAYVAK